MVLSVTEGEDKPLKYPSIFLKSDLLVLSKIDSASLRALRDGEAAEERPPRASRDGDREDLLPDR